MRKSCFLLLFCTVCAVLIAVGCSSDKGNNPTGSIEASKYPALKAMLQTALGQLCASIDDALDAQFTTDTSAIPGFAWPFEMPAHRRTAPFNYVDENTSWGVTYNFVDDTTRYVAFWDLGRLDDTGGAIGHLAPEPASSVEHDIEFGRLDGSVQSGTEWDGRLHISLTELDSDTAHLSVVITGRQKVGGECDGDFCEDYDLQLLNGTIARVGGNFDPSTLRGVIDITLKRTYFQAIVGYDATLMWAVDGTISSNGTVSLTSQSGGFSRTEAFTLCQ